jgi:hypothetical protein
MGGMSDGGEWGEVGNMLQLWFVANTILWPFILNLGGFQLSLNVVVLALAGTVWLGIKRRIAKRSLLIVAALFASLILSLGVAVAGLCQDKFPKFLITAPILMFLALVGLEIGRRANYKDWRNLQKTATWTLVVAFSTFFLEMVVPSLFPTKSGYRLQGKYSGLFNEPSHVAFSLFPCVAVLLLAENKSTRRIGLLALGGLLILSNSSTLFALIAAWFLYRLLIQRRLLQAGILALGMASLITLASAINYDQLVAPTVRRIVGVAASSDADNMSSLVYVQGWQDGYANLVRTHGLGLGFNMMGCHPLADVPTRRVLAIAGQEELNAQDGSFLFGKIVSEAGVLGIAFYVATTWWWVRLEKAIRRTEDSAERSVASMQAALVFCFIASSFIRSTGYFSGGMFLWIAAVSGTLKWQANRAQERPAPADLEAAK